MKRILFVDDDPVVFGLYCTRLEREGYAVEMASDGLAAIESLNRSKPDLVVLDLMLPEVNGVEVLKWIRRQPKLRGLPVVVLTNAYLTDMVTGAMLAGANTALYKCQCTPSKLLRVLRGFWTTSGDNGDGQSPVNGQEDAEANGRSLVTEPPLDDVDRELLQGARAEFLAAAAEEVARIRTLVLNHAKSISTPEAATHLNALYQRVHSLNVRAGLTGCVRIGILANAFEAMLYEMAAKPTSVTPSVLHTIAQATDCLGRLAQDTDQDADAGVQDARALVVDDDAVSGLFNVTSLRRMGIQVTGTKDPQEALRLLEAERYDIVLLDINMPGLDGFEVCKYLRRIPHHEQTPVIFITAHGAFENRVQSVLSGGNEFITKPVLPLELALKTVALLLDAGRRAAKATASRPATASAEAPVNPLPLAADQPAEAGCDLQEQPAPANENGGDASPAVDELRQHSTPALPRESDNGHEDEQLPDTARAATPPNAVRQARSRQPEPPSPSATATSPRQGASDTQPEPRAAGKTPPRQTESHKQPRTKQSSSQDTETLANRMAAESEALAAVQAQVESQRRQLADAQAAKAALEQINNELERQVRNLQAEMAAFREQCGLDEAQAKLKTQADALAAAEAEAQARQREAAEARAAEAALRQNLQELQQRLSTLEADLTQAQAELGTRERALAEARATVAKLEERYATALQEAQAEHAALAQARSQVARETERREAAERTAAAETEARERLQAELARLQQTAAQSLQQLDSAQAKLDALDRELTAARADAQARLQEAEQARAAEAALRQTLHDLETQLETLRAELAAGQARTRTLEETIASHESKLAAQGEELAKAQAAVTALQERYAAAAQEVQTANAALSQAQSQLAQEAARRRAAEREIAAATEARRSLQTMAEASQQAAEELRQALEAAEARIEALDRELAAARSETAARRQELTDARAAEAELRQLKQQLEQQIEALRAQASETQNRLEAQARAVAEAHTRLAAQTQALAEARAQNDTLAAQLQTLTGQLEAATGQAEAAREQLVREQAEREHLAADLAETQKAREDLANQLAAARQQEQAARLAFQQLESDYRQRLQQAEEQLRRAQQAHETTRREFQRVQYAVWEAARMHARWAGNQVQAARGFVANAELALQAVLDTPLSAAQRRLLASLQRLIAGWAQPHADTLTSGSVLPELPELKSDEFSLADLTHEIVEAVQAAAAERGLPAEMTVSGELPASAQGDAAYLRHLLVQLPAALLALPGAQRLEVRLTAAPADSGNRVELTTQYRLAAPVDTAEGRSRIEQLIAGAVQPNTSDGAAGLALAACGALARFMGGTILVETANQQELCVTLRLPLEVAAQQSAPSADASTPAVESDESWTPAASVVPADPPASETSDEAVLTVA